MNLQESMAQCFAKGDLERVCTALGISADTVLGDQSSIASMCDAIVRHAQQQNTISTLIDMCAQMHPEISWPQTSTGTPSATGKSARSDNVAAKGAEILGNVSIVNGDFIGRDSYVTITEERAYDVGGLASPYMGLRAYTYADYEIFTGRDYEIEIAVRQLCSPSGYQNLLFVTGASGSGKSSFAQAGLLPALIKHHHDRGQTTLRPVVIRPSSDPMAKLKDGLSQLDSQALSQEARVRLLIIDQFEELFTQSEQESQLQFIEWMLRLPVFEQGRMQVVVTIRSDYLANVFEFSDLWQIAKVGIELRRMGSEQLRAAIERPIQVMHPLKRFEPALLDRLVADAGADTAHLPLLQVTLDELWRSRRLVLANYKGLANAISLHADQVVAFRDFDAPVPSIRRSPEEQAVLFGMLLDLIRVTPNDELRGDTLYGYSKRTLINQPGSANSVEEGRSQLVDELVRARLLSVDDSPEQTVNIIHESLLVHWEKLKKKVQEHRDLLQQRERFRLSLTDWQKNRSVSNLLHNVLLAQAAALYDRQDIVFSDPNAVAFLEQSQKQSKQEYEEELERQRREVLALQKLAEEQRLRAEEQKRANRRLKRRAFLLAGVVLFSIVLLGFAGIMWSVSRFSTQEAVQQRIWAGRAHQQLSASSVAEQQIALPLLLEVESREQHSQTTMPERPVDLLAQSPVFLAAVQIDEPGGSLIAWQVAYSPKEDLVVAANFGSSENLQFWDVSDPQNSVKVASVDGDYATPLFHRNLTFSPDGDLLISSQSHAEQLVVWSVTQPSAPSKIAILQAKSYGAENFGAAAFHPGGELISVGTLDGAILYFDITMPSAPKLVATTRIDASAVPNDMVFGRGGSLLITGGDDKMLYIWDVSKVEHPILLASVETPSAIESLAMSRDGSTLATGGVQNEVLLWDLGEPTNPTILSELLAHTAEIRQREVSFTSDGNTLTAVGGDLFSWFVLDPINPVLRGYLYFEDSGLSGVTDSSDGERLVTASGPLLIFDSSIRSWTESMCGVARRNLTANEWRRFFPSDIYTKTCPKLPVHESVIWELTYQAQLAGAEGDMTSARTLYAQVSPMAIEMTRDSYNALTRLCRSGSAYGFSKLVMPVCDHVVRLTGNGLAYDSRAIARSLTGDLAGALEDAKNYYAIECDQESDKEKPVCQTLQRRMIDFQANKNPYDADFLDSLRGEVNGE